MRPSSAYLNIRPAATLTPVPADMLFGVGLGCLVQMIKTQADVQVSRRISNYVFCADFGSRISFLLRSSVGSRGLADVGPHRSSGPVFGAVLHHRPTEPLPLGVGIRDLSPRFLWCLSSCRTSHRIWEDLTMTLITPDAKGRCDQSQILPWFYKSTRRQTVPLLNIATALLMQTVTITRTYSQQELKLRQHAF